MSWYKKIGFAISNDGLVKDVAKVVEQQNPEASEEELEVITQEALKAATLYNDKNKKAYEAKG